MQLTKVLNGNQTKAMTTATRRGETVYFYGSRGDVYTIQPVVDAVTGEIIQTCTCGDYIYRQARVGGQCKHITAAAR
jgi:hypothetical protein